MKRIASVVDAGLVKAFSIFDWFVRRSLPRIFSSSLWNR